MTSINSIRNDLSTIAKAQMDSLASTAKVQGLDVKEILSNNVPVSKYTSYDDTFNSTKGYSGATLFENTNTQTYMGKQKPQLFAVKDIKTYYEQMCLLLPNLYGTNPSIYKGTYSYDYDPDDFDFSKKGPDGKTVYKKLNDGGSHDKIAIIDCFNSKNDEVCMYIDSTTETKIAHGEFVASLVESQLYEKGLDYTVDRLGIDIVDGEIIHGVEYMNYVLENIDEYRGVNLSIVTYCDYDTVSDLLGETVTPSNLASKKQKIMNIVMSDNATKFYEKYKDVLDQGYLPDFSDMVEDGSITQEDADSLTALLELRVMVEEYGEFYAIADEIAKKGVPVFMASGNYSDKFNFGALLTTKVEYIGSSSNSYTNPYTGDTGSYSQNSLVTRKGQATYMGNKVICQQIDVDSNGTGDISAKGVDTSTVFVTGTSFSSPSELVKAIAAGDAASASTSSANKASIGTASISAASDEGTTRIENLLSAMQDKVFTLNFAVSDDDSVKVENEDTDKSEKTTDVKTKKRKSNVIFNKTYKQVMPEKVAQEKEEKQLLANNKKTDTKSWQNIIDDLNSKVDYSTTSVTKSVNTTEMSYSELSAYFASKLSKDALSAGSLYYTKGKGSMFRYKAVEAEA